MPAQALMRAAFVLLILVTASMAQAHGERRVEFPSGAGGEPVYRESGPYELVCKRDTPKALADRVSHLQGAAWRTDPIEYKIVSEMVDLALFDPSSEETVEAMVDEQAGRWQLRETLRWAECMEAGHRHLQDAVDAVPAAGHRILVLPGLYQEEPSVARLESPPPGCEGLAQQRILTYAQQVACPNQHNTVAILGDDPDDADIACTTERLCHLQLEGTGLHREDVIVDAAWNHLNAIRADRADGFYVTGITAQRTDFNALYVLQTDGFVIDDVLTRWNYEYGFLTFAVDHGLYTDCESYGNGDSGIYPGSAADLGAERHSIEIRHCDSHHNMLGYSGTAGNAVWAHNNSFHHNVAGIATDSLFPDHPGLPQDHARFEDNLIFSNNENYYDHWLPGGPCHEPLAQRGIEDGVVCPVVPLPVGTGIVIAGGNDNIVARNHIFDNWRYGTMLFGVPSLFRGEDGGIDLFCLLADPSDTCIAPTQEELEEMVATQKDTSHRNRFLDNHMGIPPKGQWGWDGVIPWSFGGDLPNGRDHWWDESGIGNCWRGNQYAGDGPRQEMPDATLLFPTCGDDPLASVDRPYHPRLATIVPCNEYSVPDNTHPDGCSWMSDPEAPA